MINICCAFKIAGGVCLRGGPPKDLPIGTNMEEVIISDTAGGDNKGISDKSVAGLADRQICGVKGKTKDKSNPLMEKMPGVSLEAASNPVLSENLGRDLLTSYFPLLDVTNSGCSRYLSTLFRCFLSLIIPTLYRPLIWHRLSTLHECCTP